MCTKGKSGLPGPEPSPARSFSDNVEELEKAFGYPDGMDWRLKKKKRLASVEAEDPVAAATMFAGIASEGFVSEVISDKGYRRVLADGTIVGLRIVTSSEGGPAVDLDIVGENHVRKIHFYKGGN